MTHVQFNRRPLEKSFNNLFDDLFAGLPVIYKSDQQWKCFAPVNIKETGNAYHIEVVAPGFEKENFKVNVEQNILTVSAEKKEEVKEDGQKEIRREHNYRSFKRSFTLDEKVNAAGIEAKYVNGVLTLNLPKKEEVKESAKEIAIQ